MILNNGFEEMNMKVTVLGGGHGCYAAAVEMAEKGHEVVLWRRDRAALQELAQAETLHIKDFQGNRSVTVGLLPPRRLGWRLCRIR